MGGSIRPEPESGLAKLARRAWGGVRSFLEIIGLIEAKRVDQDLELSRFKVFHTEFRKLLSANNSFLETINDLEERRGQAPPPEGDFLRRKAVRAVADIHAMVDSLQAISGGGYPALSPALDRLTAGLAAALGETLEEAKASLILDLSEIRAGEADVVGGKMANLAALRNLLGLPTPDGFAVTTQGYRVFLEEGGLTSWLQSVLLELHHESEAAQVSAELRRGISEVGAPPGLAAAILEAYDRLAERLGRAPLVAVRSSAHGEDSEISYAGQFLTRLNVGREGLVAAYVEVVASLFSLEAVHYRFLHKLPQEPAPMAVGVLAQVPAKVSGVAFSRDPAAPDSGRVLIQAVRGLGVSLVDGRTSPEKIEVPRQGQPGEIVLRPGAQESLVETAAAGGTREVALSPEASGQPCLGEAEARELARLVERIEAHFKTTQDVEWALDQDRRVFLLQARPLRLTGPAPARRPPLEGQTVLVAGGETACPGVGSGPAVHLDEEGHLEAFPAGAVLVAPRSSPRFVRLLGKARAVVTDHGSTTGHMASLAREFRTPALLGARVATKRIPAGAVVTVDAGSGYVYLGEVSLAPGKEAGPSVPEDGREVEPPRPKGPEWAFTDRVLAHLAPLTLTDPSSAEFSPEKALSLHDLARFIHEKSYGEMFGLGERLGDVRQSSFLLDVFLPIDLYIVDLGGGFVERPKGDKVKPRQIASVPLTALLKGMLDKRIPRFGAKPLSLGGLMAVMMRHATESPDQDRTFADPSYALISQPYLNFTARVGYHFSVVDAYCGATANKNYISLLFRGGAADQIRRNRRVRAIAAILREEGFAVRVDRDAVTARMSKTSREETATHLEMIGRLLQFFRQLDAAMAGEEAVETVKSAFLRGDYDLLKLSEGRGREGG